MSQASYIIICDGRIDAALAKNGFEMIRAASRVATNLVTYYGQRLSESDAKPISELQHRMMEVVSSRSATDDAGDMVDEMFALLDELEQKLS